MLQQPLPSGNRPDVIYYPQQTVGLTASVAALGFFDGLHPAHRALLRDARAVARERGLPFLVVTFPSEAALKPGAARLLTTEEKLRLLAEEGADAIVVLDFAAVASMSPQTFVRQVLLQACGVRVAVVGYNYRFGCGAAGDVPLLRRLLAEAGGEVRVTREIRYDGQTLSTSLIRRLLSEGQLEAVTEALGRPFALHGRVVHGCGRGAALGIPTANTPLTGAALLLPHGVYATAVPLGGRMYTGVTNVGTCPTFGEREAHAETLLVDFSGDLYCEDLQIWLLAYLRPERAFPDAQSLLRQIEEDKKYAIRRKGEMKWQESGQS